MKRLVAPMLLALVACSGPEPTPGAAVPPDPPPTPAPVTPTPPAPLGEGPALVLETTAAGGGVEVRVVGRRLSRC
jgi:hypothetical protein